MLSQGAVAIILAGAKRKAQEKAEGLEHEEPDNKKQKAANKKMQASKKSEYELEPDSEERGGEGNEEDAIVSGLCPHARLVLEKPLSTYPATKEGRKLLIKDTRDALRDQMGFEGKSKAVGPCSTTHFFLIKKIIVLEPLLLKCFHLLLMSLRVGLSTVSEDLLIICYAC